ncbi:4-hydroxyphenylpyruvate dioxygenase [Azospirillum sp. RWY-5-1]|uniref:4-hydroxyphenylpyruvate dioxygenase n=1 Tax=Azospirillum oleiclasticum TaxID=2735135 RepID=A0ABX2TD52_9PROT|nr:4-hydroxyphenylpyruvate dioxygenase [Azospirillum oleiclasticum]NYZ15834.1 4-hydroxyphenylpyruvate dioxygenase [Azospirillum oleiclasticum]NYZ22104.1 4-hydroxyphenylpyruvate dioxygenase [Azospirillum oleiclasticum]
MGVPIERASDRTAPGQVHDNPVGTNGIPFIEFSAADIRPVADLLGRLGFRPVARHRTQSVALWRQGGIDILLNDDPATHGTAFAGRHGPCISALSFRVADVALAKARAEAGGAEPYRGERGATAVEAVAMTGIGGSLLYLVDEETERRIKEQEFIPLEGDSLPDVPGVGFLEIDHLTHNVAAGNMDRWTEFYRDAFNFRDVFYLNTKGQKTGFRTRAMKSPCGRICIPVNEPTDPKSQIQEYIDVYKGEGVQHLAFLSGDLNGSIERIAGAGIPMMDIPDSYYDGVDARMPGHGQDLARLKANGILMDGEREEGAWTILLQIFSKNLIGPIFFEFIERRDNDGFGDNNAKALFEAIERDQMKRGVVAS